MSFTLFLSNTILMITQSLSCNLKFPLTLTKMTNSSQQFAPSQMMESIGLNSKQIAISIKHLTSRNNEVYRL